MVDIKAYVEKGYIHTRVILEVVGKPAEHVKKATEDYIEKITKDEKIVIIDKFISEITKMENTDMFSTFAEIELLIKGFDELSLFCFNYMPASIEILEPSRLVVDANKMTNLFNDFQSKLHRADFMSKTLKQKNELFLANLSGMIKNSLFILLKDGGMELQKICKFTGLSEKDMSNYLESLIKEGKIKKIGNKYFYEF